MRRSVIVRSKRALGIAIIAIGLARVYAYPYSDGWEDVFPLTVFHSAIIFFTCVSCLIIIASIGRFALEAVIDQIKRFYHRSSIGSPLNFLRIYRW